MQFRRGTPKDAAHDPAVLTREVRRLRSLVASLRMPLPAALRLRGFTVFSANPSDDLLVPAEPFRDRYYRLMDRYSFRLFLRDVIKHQDGFSVDDVSRYATASVAARYLEFMRHAGLILIEQGRYRYAGTRIRSFGETLEWYVAEVLRREFSGEVLWGVKFRKPHVGGDFDIIARLDTSLCYLEVKSSPPKQVFSSEIRAFLTRVIDLSPDIAVFLMDTELRMKDKIVPMFEEELGVRPDLPAGPERIEKELFRIGGRIFIINAKGRIAGNLAKIFRWYFQGV